MAAQDAREAPLLVFPCGTDLLAEAARLCIARHAPRLPDLSQVAILLPHAAQGRRLGGLLLDEARSLGHEALLGPEITTLDHWLQHHYPLDRPVMDASTALLWLLGALRHHPDLYGEGSALGLAESLLALFDELARQAVTLPANLEDCRALLARAYGLGARGHALQSREARLVHTLWRAWQEELDARASWDAAFARRARLDLAARECQTFLYLLAPDEYDRGLARFAERRCRDGRAAVLLHAAGNPYGPAEDSPLRGALSNLPRAHIPHSPNARRECLDAVYARDAALARRARDLAAVHAESPLREHIAVHLAQGLEEAARGVDVQVRRWLLAGEHQDPLPNPLPLTGEGARADNIKTIAIVSEDRKLARRVRALLERGGIAIEDGAGWALSTTRAAAAVEHWLICVEEDFPQRTLLDLLQSPFFGTETGRDAHLETVARFERDIVRHENIARGLDRYRQHLRYRRDHLLGEAWSPQRHSEALDLLERLDEAARPIRSLLTGAHTLPRHLRALRTGLDRLGIWAQLLADPAGERIASRIEVLGAQTDASGLTLDWGEFRALLGRLLEQENFLPTAHGPIRLLSLAQAAHGRFDALIIAGAEAEFLPGPPAQTPFFNDSVRHELGLPGAREQLMQRFSAFRDLLEAAPRVLISARREEDGEDIAPSPWLAALRTFHKLAWQDDLGDPELTALAKDARTQVATDDGTPLPAPTSRPRPSWSGRALPEYISVSAHQRLVDCPYRFFADTLLSLGPSDEVRETLEKRDYGQRVHRCLQAFHEDIADLPGPWHGALGGEQRDDAITLLTRISQAVFARDIEDNFEHRGWLTHWLKHVPDYVDWQIAHGSEVVASESAHEAPLTGGVTLRGKLDRVERAADGTLAILDYKTGKPPKDIQLASGEFVQLPSYALLHPTADRVAYLGLDESPITDKTAIEGETLAELRDAVGARLSQVIEAIRAGAALPAWGDAKTCQYCDYIGVCRRGTWVDKQSL